MTSQSTQLIGALAAYNIVQNRWFNRRGYVTANLVVTFAAVNWARRSGIGRDEMGLGKESLARGLATGGLVAAVGAGLAVLGRESVVARKALSDDRLLGVGRSDAVRRVLVRFPLGTALFEEVVFRGVLPATMLHRPAWQADLISAGAFAAWHLIPTSHAIDSNEQARGLSQGQRTAIVVGGSLAAGSAGVLLSALRRTTGSLAAPWLTHAVANGVALCLALRSAPPDPSTVR